MGNGIPFPHSGSLSSRLFLFTILWPGTLPACCPARPCAATEPVAQVNRRRGSGFGSHDMIGGFVLRKMAASVGLSASIRRERERGRERERRGRGGRRVSE